MKNFLTRSLFFLLFILFTSCAQNGRWSTSVDWEDFQLSELPTSAQYPGADAVILLDEGSMNLTGQAGSGQTEYTRHTIIKIFNENGFQYSNVTIPYNQSNRITAIEARTILKDGQIFVLKEKDIFDITLFPSFVFYSDQRAKRFTLPAVEKNCVIEYRYKIKAKQHNLLHSWAFQSFIPTIISRFKLKAPADYKIDSRAYGKEDVSFSTDSSAVSTFRYTWKARNLPEIKREIAMPSVNDLQTEVIFKPIGFKGWQDVADWYHSLSGPAMEPTEKIKGLTESIINNADTNIQKLNAIFDWVRDHIRYVAVAIGIGGFKPHPAEEVLLNRYGDCKDMTTLLCAMAKSVDLDLQQALISTEQNGGLDTTIASPFHFNHVIAYTSQYSDSGIWLDATKKGVPFQSIPWYNRNTIAFVVDDSGNGRFRKTPSGDVHDNLHALKWDVNFNDHFEADIRGVSEFSDALAGEIRQELEISDSSLQRNWIEAYLTLRTPNVDLISWEISGLEPVSDSLKIAYRFKSKSLIDRENESYILRPASVVVTELPDIFYASNRMNPIEFRFGSLKQCEIRYHLPRHMKLSNRRLGDLVTSKFGYYKDKIELNEDILDFTGNFGIELTKIEVRDYNEFRKFLGDVKKAEDRIMILTEIKQLP